MDSECGQFQNTQNTSGLLRFRSAPVSLFANLTDLASEKDGGVAAATGLSSRFNLSGGSPENLKDNDNKGAINGGYGGMNSHSQLPPQYPRQTGGAASQVGSLNGGGFRVVGSMGMEMGHHGQPKIGSNLTRQNSSPPGLFSHLTSQNDYATIRGPGSYRVANGSTGDLSPASTRLKGQMSYSSGLSSSVGVLSRISEVENENGLAAGAAHEKLGNENRGTQIYSSGYPFGSWNNPSNFVESLTSLKREEDSDVKSFVNSQTGDLRNISPILSHQLSLPNTSAEMAAMEKLLHFQDSVPCKIRAKRGCATHPRSIAERVRRTRISERMRKLQELVPNMDKQTNTADMLDLAVEYIKDLQNRFKTLTDTRAKCKCTVMQKQVHTSSFK